MTCRVHSLNNSRLEQNILVFFMFLLNVFLATLFVYSYQADTQFRCSVDTLVNSTIKNFQTFDFGLQFGKITDTFGKLYNITKLVDRLDKIGEFYNNTDIYMYLFQKHSY